MSRATWPLAGALFLLSPGCHGGGGGAVEPDTGVADGGPRTSAPVPRREPDAAVEDAAAPEDAEAPSDAGADPSDALFEPGRVLEVRITLSPADWETLRNQRPGADTDRTSCAGPASAEPYTDFRADLDIDGVALPNVAVRKKGGLGSVSSTRPGLRVDVHEYAAEQDLYGLEHLTLNNNHQDPALIRQCLGYGLFRAAGLPAPRCSFAHVVVNGEDLGIYSNVEPIKKEFLRRNFADATGEVYESGGDFAPGQVESFEPKSATVPADCSPLDAVATALAAPDAQLPGALGAVLDLPQFTRYWAMEVITDHWDGYANNQNNFYLYQEPSSGRLSFIPWGLDALFSGRSRTTRPYSVFACGALAWRLYDVDATRGTYLSTVRALLGSVWNAPAILAEIARMEALIAPFVAPSEASAWAEELGKVRSFVSGRAATLLRELDAGEPLWPYPADASCRIRIGSVSASFSTSWNTLDAFDVGSGTITGNVGSVNLASSLVRASAGIGDDGKTVIRLLSPLPDGRYAAVYVVVEDAADLVPGTRTIDLSNLAAVISFYDPATDTATAGELLFPGSVTVDSAGTNPGATVAGSLSADVMEL
jgi:CotH kinase protein